jgi:hypothetical protein
MVEDANEKKPMFCRLQNARKTEKIIIEILQTDDIIIEILQTDDISTFCSVISSNESSRRILRSPAPVDLF